MYRVTNYPETPTHQPIKLIKPIKPIKLIKLIKLIIRAKMSSIRNLFERDLDYGL